MGVRLHEDGRLKALILSLMSGLSFTLGAICVPGLFLNRLEDLTDSPYAALGIFLFVSSALGMVGGGLTGYLLKPHTSSPWLLPLAAPGIYAGIAFLLFLGAGWLATFWIPMAICSAIGVVIGYVSRRDALS